MSWILRISRFFLLMSVNWMPIDLINSMRWNWQNDAQCSQNIQWIGSFLQSRIAIFSSLRHDFTCLTVIMSCNSWHELCKTWPVLERAEWWLMLHVSPSAAQTQNGPNVAKNYQHEPFRLTVIANWPMGRCKWVNWPIRGQYSDQLTNENTGNGPSDLGAVKLILLLQRPWQQSLKRNCPDHLEQEEPLLLISSERAKTAAALLLSFIQK